MKATGIIRGVDKVGRIVLPAELRQSLDINHGDAIEIYTEEDKIILKKYSPSCVFCGSNDQMVCYKGKFICSSCQNTISKHQEIK